MAGVAVKHVSRRVRSMSGFAHESGQDEEAAGVHLGVCEGPLPMKGAVVVVVEVLGGGWRANAVSFVPSRGQMEVSRGVVGQSGAQAGATSNR